MITTTSEERNDDDLLSRIDIAREKIFETIKEYNDKMTAATSQVDGLVDSLREQIRELHQQLNNTEAISNELKKEYDERLRNITQNQQESERDEGLRLLENENISRLQQEVDLCEKELEQVENEPLAEDLSDHEQLQMALFRGMGIEMKVEEDSKVRKTILSSPNSQDIITFPIDDFSATFTANYIWDFISKGL